MTLTLHIPDVLASSLGNVERDVTRTVVEGFAVEAYRSGTLSLAEVRELLDHASRWETEDFLAKHGAWPDPSESEVMGDIETLLPPRSP